MEIRPSLATAAVLALAALVACGRAGEPATPAAEARAAAAAPVPEVTVARPTHDAVRTEAEAPGTFMPYDETTLSAEGVGPIERITVEEGVRVKTGQVLVVQDTTKATLAVRQAEAMLAQARANFARARADLERKQLLLNDKTIPQNQFDSFKAQYDGASAAVDAADTALSLSRRQLEDLTTRAPYDGVIKEKRVSLGTYVRGGDAMLVIMRVDPLKLQFELPEKYASRVREGLAVRASVTALPGETIAGTVRTVFPSVSVQSRAVRVEATVANPGYRLKPGFFASVKVPLASLGGSVTIPRGALVRREGTENVFVVRGDRAELVPIQTGAETADLVEVVVGLTETDPIVVDGAQTLQPGDRVKVRG
jgi:membrane fusion protein (multidrug efflux system)